MKATYNDFLQENPPCRKFDSDVNAQNIFKLLSRDDNIIKMINAAEAGKPALTPVVSLVEEYFDVNIAPQSSFDLRKSFPRSAVGRMIKTILAPFGYLVITPATITQKSLPKAANAKYFTSASCYKKTGQATLQIIHTITEVK